MKLAIFDTFSMYVFSGGSSENYFTPTPKRWRSSLKVPHPKRFEENSWICFFHRSHPCCQARSRRRGVGGKAGRISWRSSETWGNPDPQNAEKFRCLGFLFGQFAQNEGSVGVLLDVLLKVFNDEKNGMFVDTSWWKNSSDHHRLDGAKTRRK